MMESKLSRHYPDSPSVGIVTRTKDRAVLLRRALESVRNQNYPNWRLVVVNDGGDPGPVEALVRDFLPGDERVTLLHHEASKGMEAASNAGISALDTDLAIIHDDDDSWAPEMLSVATQVLVARNAQFPSVRGIVCKINAVNETVTGNHVKIISIEDWYASRHSHFNEGFVDLSTILVRNLFPPIGFLFDRAICVELGMFNAELPVLGDWDFNVRFCSAHDIWVHPEALAFYHLRHDATGALGNTVVSGNDKHVTYGQYLRNQWLRDAIGEDGPASPLAGELRAIGEQLERIEESLYRAGISAPAPRVGKKPKRGMAKALSDLNRRRKKWI